MSYDPEHHITTAEQCPERIKVRKDDLVAYQCLRMEHHPGLHVAQCGNNKQAEWWTPREEHA